MQRDALGRTRTSDGLSLSGREMLSFMSCIIKYILRQGTVCTCGQAFGAS